MLRLILGRAPSRCSVGEYVDAIGAVGDGRSLGLPHWALTPGVLTLFQGPILFRRDLMQCGQAADGYSVSDRGNRACAFEVLPYNTGEFFERGFDDYADRCQPKHFAWFVP